MAWQLARGSSWAQKRVLAKPGLGAVFMKTKCKVLHCGCFKFEEDIVAEAPGIRCYCRHAPEEHFKTCACGAARFLGLCPWSSLGITILVIFIAFGFWLAR